MTDPTPATVVLVEKQHSSMTPEWFDHVAVCRDWIVAGDVAMGVLQEDDWRDSDDIRLTEQRILTEAPR